MTKSAARAFLFVSSLACAGLFVVPALAAAEKRTSEKSEAQKKQDEANLKKYDKNRNGKLDPDELAERKADQHKAKRGKRS